MSLWKTIKQLFTSTETLKDEFLKTIAEEIDETPEEVKAVVSAAKKLQTKPVKSATTKTVRSTKTKRG